MILIFTFDNWIIYNMVPQKSKTIVYNAPPYNIFYFSTNQVRISQKGTQI